MMKYIMAIIIMVVALSMNSWAMAGGSDKAVAASQSREVTFSIDNMTCALCPITVRKAMEKVAGVTDVKVDFEAKMATVHFDPSRATIEAIALASTNAGYPARISGEK